MTRLLASTQTALARAWSASIRHLREENPVEQLAERIRIHVHPDALISGLNESLASFAAAEHNAYIAAAQSTARQAESATRISKKLLNFDPADPDVLTWAERNRLDKVRALTFEQRSLIRAMLIRIDEDGTNPLEAAKDILDSLGLTPAQDAIVASYRRSLQAGQFSEALQRELSSGNADRVIAAAQRASRSLTTEQINRAVDQYRANFIRLRAETIARTESQRIAHQGSDALYAQAIRRGDLVAEQLECEWLHSPTAKDKSHERKFHKVMHGQKRAYGEPFVSGLGNELMFPGDPDAPPEEVIGCRCARTVRIRPARTLANAA